MKRPLWIDCDAGVDDAQAIVLAAGAEEFEIVGVSCVHGNVVLSQVVKNVHRILNVCDLPDVPVYVGCAKPLLSDPVNAEAFHGEDGLGDVPHIHPAPEHLQNPEHNSTSASLALIQAAQQYAGKLTVVALGPLTNVALAYQLDHSLPSKIAALYVMGGAAGPGNITPTAEFNFYCDPEAAAAVLRNFPQLTLVCWQCCVRSVLPWGWVDEWLSRSEHSKRGAFIAGTMSASVERHREKFPDSGVITCDPLAMAAALRPEVVASSQQVCCDVECQGSLTRGMSVIDWQDQWGKPANVVLVKEFDIPMFCQMMMDACTK